MAETVYLSNETARAIVLALGGTPPDEGSPEGDAVYLTEAMGQALLQAIQQGRIGGGYETGIAATGTGQGDAYQLTKAFNEVTSSDGTNGVRLDLDLAVGSMMVVTVNVGNNTKIYPHVGGQIDELAVNDPQSTSRSTYVFWRATATRWYAISRENLAAAAPP